MDKHRERSKEIINKIKEMEHQGYQYEAAEASFELLVKEALGELNQYFSLQHFKVLTEKVGSGWVNTEAVVKLRINQEVVHTAAEGNGPVNALDHALRKALEQYFPILKKMYLSDYKVRVLDEANATASKVRVLIESSDGKEKWSTIGVSTNIIEASWHALIDSFRYYLMKHEDEMEMPAAQLQAMEK